MTDLNQPTQSVQATVAPPAEKQSVAAEVEAKFLSWEVDHKRLVVLAAVLVLGIVVGAVVF